MGRSLITVTSESCHGERRRPSARDAAAVALQLEARRRHLDELVMAEVYRVGGDDGVAMIVVAPHRYRHQQQPDCFAGEVSRQIVVTIEVTSSLDDFELSSSDSTFVCAATW